MPAKKESAYDLVRPKQREFKLVDKVRKFQDISAVLIVQSTSRVESATVDNDEKKVRTINEISIGHWSRTTNWRFW